MLLSGRTAGSSWQIKDVPSLNPAPNQVLVKMHASGICYADVHETLGHLPGRISANPQARPVSESTPCST